MDHSGETEKRLRKILEGAFSGPPTPLKAIPKKNGESRAVKSVMGERLKKQSESSKKPLGD
jgi:hypothetical protein